MNEKMGAYLAELKVALEDIGADPALVQDAEFDAAEYLQAALDSGESVADAVSEFGSAAEVADSYLAAEDVVERALRPPTRSAKGLYTKPDTRTWASVAYLLLSLGTGIAYFTIAAVGIAVSASLAIFVIGIPIFLLFLGVVRSISLVEGRIIETLLGIRMPRRPLLEPAGSWLERFKHWLVDRRTWTSVLYMAGQLPLGIGYFTAMVAGSVVAVWLVFMPWVQAFSGLPFLPDFNGADYYLDAWAVLPASAAGVLLLLFVFAFARFVGKWHARYAKWMLVGAFGQVR